jgi:hypothetical protein
VERHAGLQAETLGARYGFHRAGSAVRLLELLELLELLICYLLSAICYWLFAKRCCYQSRACSSLIRA